jgi:hypothetical protein
MKKVTQAFAVAGSAFNTVGMDLGDLSLFSVQLKFVGGALAGTGKIQVSNDDVEYVDAGISATIASGASLLLNVSNAGFQYARLVWTPSGGSGTATAISVVKG